MKTARGTANQPPSTIRATKIPRSGLVQSAYCGAPQYAELERSQIRERTKAGIAAAKERGVQFGRRKKLKPYHLNPA
jgi:hypothetical protein